jgi:hypothetical protein
VAENLNIIVLLVHLVRELQVDLLHHELVVATFAHLPFLKRKGSRSVHTFIARTMAAEVKELWLAILREVLLARPAALGFSVHLEYWAFHFQNGVIEVEVHIHLADLDLVFLHFVLARNHLLYVLLLVEELW